jgi:hypothetical protein
VGALAPIMAELHRCDLAGKRVLDIGCRDGLFSFEAEKMGAQEVLGIDNDLSPGATEFLIPWFQSKVRMQAVNLYDFVVPSEPQRNNIHGINRPVASVLMPENGFTFTRRLAYVCRRKQSNIRANERFGDIEEPVVTDQPKPKRIVRPFMVCNIFGRSRHLIQTQIATVASPFRKLL